MLSKDLLCFPFGFLGKNIPALCWKIKHYIKMNFWCKVKYLKSFFYSINLSYNKHTHTRNDK